MTSRVHKGYVHRDGRVQIVDPDYGMLRLVRMVTPAFTIKSEPPPPDYQPRLGCTRRIVSDIRIDDLHAINLPRLWDLHDSLVHESPHQGRPVGRATLLDIKQEVAERLMTDCRMCGHACGIDRFRERGRCGLLDEAVVDELYVHIAEEPPVTPTAAIKIGGCALKCRECQAHEALSRVSEGTKLGPSTFQEIRTCDGFEEAVSLELVGGDPNESLFAILDALSLSPEIPLPIIWNTHAYGSPDCYRLLDGVVDVYVPDMKGCNACLETYAAVRRYWDYATAGVEAMLQQHARVIVRLLVMAGHGSCCHEHAVRWLAQHRDRVWVSIYGLVPAWKRAMPVTSPDEVTRVEHLARGLGLRMIGESGGRFWI
ncbi:MAG: hypothetical protein AB1806_15255 [Acidobacteriota bacterium]